MMYSQRVLEMSDKELVEHVAKQIEAIKKLKRLNAFISVNENAGVKPTISVKDNILVKGMRTTASSLIIDNYVAPYSATAVERIRGLSIIGKTACDSFGAGSAGVNSDYGAVKNPIDESLVAGGSSAGNGVALASDMCDFALGSDTYGSLRSPSAFCGVVGMRPTYGLVSRYGLMDLAMSFDTIGPMARDVYGTAYVLSMIAGHDERDCLSEKTKRIEYHKQLNVEPKKMTMVVLDEIESDLVDKRISKPVLNAVDSLEKEGVKKITAKLPDLEKSIPMYYLSMSAEFSSAMQKFDGLKYGRGGDGTTLEECVSSARGKSFNAEIKRRIILGTFVSMKEHSEKWYSSALKARASLKKEITKVMLKGDVLITPTMPVLPWKINDVIDDPLKLYAMDLFSGLAPISGGPALSVPCGKFIGIQFGGKRFDDLKCLQTGRLLEGLL